ncbi:MAG: glycerol-3-phosphate 1-O-acyltransferase PlsY [Pseudomonadota bacterium]
MTLTLLLIGALGFGYLLGSIPTGLLLTRYAGLGDVRDIGSGNIGATNVLRTGRKDLAVFTLLGDALKGLAAVLIAAQWGVEAGLAAGLGAFMGHLFPIWLGFKGGKGVATFIGVLFATAWPAGLVFAAIWLGMAFLFRYSSLSALTASAATPIVVFGIASSQAAGLFVILAALLWYAHRGNIRRLLEGSETKIGGGKANPDR